MRAESHVSMPSIRVQLSRFGCVLLVVMVAWTLQLESRVRQAPPTFRGSSELVLIDVEAVDRDGRPVAGLSAEKFAVSFDGKKRQVVSASFIGSAAAAHAVNEIADTGNGAAPGSFAEPSARRAIVLALDCGTFEVRSSRVVAQAATAFVRRLSPQDRVGLFAFPHGPRVDVTTDHERVIAALGDVVGQRAGGPINPWGFRPADMVDMIAEERQSFDPTRPSAVQRACGDNRQCAFDALRLARLMADEYEGQALASLRTLRSLFVGLGASAERKTVVLVSAGSPVSDRPGGRPDVRSFQADVGRDAAKANVTLYTLFVDQALLDSNSAEVRIRSKNQTSLERDSTLLGSWLDELSGAAGGVRQKVLLGGGDAAYDRILRETSAYYLLGVQPEDRDRDGKAHTIDVKVNVRGAVVRAKKFVFITASP